ncbi:MAG: Asp-tRNA(Asn)/Glu-tRNA(Gln) amidotransferase subunit GatB [Candidatus Omnitrophica bacterium]|nr:Asp-tRNA(Asn)/Glu-tRNA(Gln) amidotransferase subunit GatB [Candidatus Omnitrophota bacterium]
MSNFEIVIGLEVHTQLKTKSKIFCSCSTEFKSPPNTNICPVCCGYPGVLPVFNKKVLELAVRVSLALKCETNKSIYFERKNYFYPDLPKDYQISQYKMPLGERGILELPSGKKVNINRVHMEEDAGKLIHKEDCSLVDFNRTGTPLLEIVSEPDIRSPQEAYDYLTYLKLVIQYIGSSDCDMEKGSLRCDANISLRRHGDTKLGTRVELKNMNSFRGVRAALEFEAKRQAKAIESGEKIIQETRLWDVDNLKTVVMRTKEQAHDYRYFPEPDLLDFSVSNELIEGEKALVGELPIERKERFLKEYKINQKEVDIILASPWLANFFEEANKAYPKSQELSNWLLGPFLEQVNALEKGFDSVKISTQKFAQIVRYFSEKKLNNLAAKKVLSLSIATDQDIDGIIEGEGLTQVSGEDQLSLFIEEAIKDNPKPVKEYLEGKEQAIMFLVGQVMKKSRGNANPQVAKDMLKRRIEE